MTARRCDVDGCERSRGHRGEHRAGDRAWPRAIGSGNRPPSASALERADRVLTRLVAGDSQADIAREEGVSRQRVHAIAVAAGQAGPAQLLADLRRRAERHGIDPDEFLEVADATYKLGSQIVDLLAEAYEADTLTERELTIWALANAKPSKETVRKVRAFLGAVAELDADDLD